MNPAVRTFLTLGVAVPVLSVLLFRWVSSSDPAERVPVVVSRPLARQSDEDRPSKSPPAATPGPSADAFVSPAGPVPKGSARDVREEASSREEPFARPATEQDYFKRLEELKKEDKNRALSYALAGEKWYSDSGKPAQARRAMIVTLLVDLDRMAEARDWTKAFLEQYPQSPYRPLVQGVTGIHPRPGPPPGAR